MRISALPTLWSNVLTAYWIAYNSGPAPHHNIPHHNIHNIPHHNLFHLPLLIIICSLFYLAGMVLNDFYGAEQDAISRPERPISSGAISRHTAGLLGFGLLFSALLLTFFLAYFYWFSPRCVPDAIILTLLIWYYNIPKKLFVCLNPVIMGACRFCNIWFIFAVVGSGSTFYAIFVFFYITILTFLAQFEVESPRIRKMVVLSLASLIAIDAFFVLALVGPVHATIILLLFIPVVLFRRIVSMT
ncbi:MAG: UbiA family prenyltransferase [Thermoguttaceae bacterium]